MKTSPVCPVHNTPLVCPRCVGAKGGKKTAQTHKNKLRTWGKMGGRPNPKKPRGKKT